jgi:hypothetical protein
MSDRIVTASAKEQVEEQDVPSSEIFPTRYKRSIAAVSLGLLAGAACAAGCSGPLELSLLNGTEQAPRADERPRDRGPRPYWENDPLFVAPPL